MAFISCPNPFSPCFDNSSPFQNISSEAPDQFQFLSCYAGYFGARAMGTPFAARTECFNRKNPPFSDGRGGFIPNPPPGDGTGGVDYPPLGIDWEQETDGFWVFSDESQEDADLTAMQLASEANADDWPTVTIDPNTGLTVATPAERFPNQAQTCTVTCPDGTTFSFTVAQGAFLARSTSEANAIAHSFACRQAEINQLCFIDLLSSGCVGDVYSGTIVAASFDPHITFDITSGTIPPGLFTSSATTGNTFIFNGTPTTSGNYTFTVMATDSHGNFMSKAFTIPVLGIDEGPVLPSVVAGSSYSQNLNTTGGTGPYTYTLEDGILPPGLSLNSVGIISGTVPSGTEPEVFTFDIRTTDSEGNTCFEGLSIQVLGCPDWDALLWSETSAGTTPPGQPASWSWTPGAGAQGNDLTMTTSVNMPVFTYLTSLSVLATMSYKGAACNGLLDVVFSNSSNGIFPNRGHMRCQVVYDDGMGNTQLAVIDTEDAGTHHYTAGFTMPDTGGQTWVIRVFGVCEVNGDTATVTFTASINNV